MNVEKLNILKNSVDKQQYPFRMQENEITELELHGIVVAYGQSDDGFVLSGAINEHCYIYNDKQVVTIDNKGIVHPYHSNMPESEAQEYSSRKNGQVKEITAFFDKGEYTWQYETDIPHVTFDIMEDDEKYCRGIIFDISDI